MTFPFDKAIKISSRPLLRECSYNHESPEKMANRLFTDLMTELLGGRPKDGTPPRAEETAVEMIRQGLSKNNIMFCFTYLAIPLEHSTFYLYRGEPDKRVVQVDWKSYRCTVRPNLPPKELARAILAFDAQCPELENRMTEFLGRIGAERKAAEIQRITVQSQLSAVIPDMGLDCIFTLKDGSVHLELTRTFQGSVDLPLAELQAFLADPERILGILQPRKDGFVDDSDSVFPGRHAKFRFP